MGLCQRSVKLEIRVLMLPKKSHLVMTIGKRDGVVDYLQRLVILHRHCAICFFQSSTRLNSPKFFHLTAEGSIFSWYEIQIEKVFIGGTKGTTKDALSKTRLHCKGLISFTSSDF